jgi:hypothetical protein
MNITYPAGFIDDVAVFEKSVLNNGLAGLNHLGSNLDLVSLRASIALAMRSQCVTTVLPRFCYVKPHFPLPPISISTAPGS